jgi:hypothetical protein
MKSMSDEFCNVCGEEAEVRCTGHTSAPFVDGKKYPLLCQYCLEVPKMWAYYEETGIVCYNEMDPKRLCTVDEMLENFSNINRIKKSIASVKRIIKKARL